MSETPTRKGSNLQKWSLGFFAIAGGLLFAWPFFSSPLFIQQETPGKIVAVEDLKVWRSPTTGPKKHIQGLGDAQASFEIKNTGGTPVEIVQVESSCGCATPIVRPRTLAPGQTDIVEVMAAPLSIGEKVASVTLTTNSPLTPKVVLQLRIVGSRRPPLMGQMGGELSFIGSVTSAMTRSIYVQTVELEGSAPEPPPLTSTLSELSIGSPRLVQEVADTGTHSVVRRYEYEASVMNAPAEELLAGDVIAVDPWDSTHEERIRVHLERRPSLRAIPKRVILNASNLGESEEGAKVVILTEEPSLDLLIECEEPLATPLIVRRLESSEDNRQHIFTISVNPDVRDGVSGEYQVFVSCPSDGQKLRVPVLIRSGDAR